MFHLRVIASWEGVIPAACGGWRNGGGRLEQNQNTMQQHILAPLPLLSPCPVLPPSASASLLRSSSTPGHLVRADSDVAPLRQSRVRGGLGGRCSAAGVPGPRAPRAPRAGAEMGSLWVSGSRQGVWRWHELGIWAPGLECLHRYCWVGAPGSLDIPALGVGR